MVGPGGTAAEVIASVVDKHAEEMIDLRRDLHMYPELAWNEKRTIDKVAEHLEPLGWRVQRLPRAGLIADIGPEDQRCVALRADTDALPVTDVCDEEFASTIPGVAHACGHDVHTAALTGAAYALAELADRGELPGRVRLLFQPAEEVMPGGAKHLLAQDVLRDVDRIYALHCEPSVDVGRAGLRAGAMTSAADLIEVRLEGTGGHTSRPHLTEDLTFALAKLATELSAVLSRRMDPRAGVSVTWGMLQAGSAPNVIPHEGYAAGTVRILDAEAWADCERIVRSAVGDIVRPYGLTPTLDYLQGVPPVVNDPAANAGLAKAVLSVLGTHGQVSVPQSLGGEDFGWYLEEVPGAMFRLGTRTPGGPTYDLHQGNLRVDEQAIAIGAKILAEAAVGSLISLR